MFLKVSIRCILFLSMLCATGFAQRNNRSTAVMETASAQTGTTTDISSERPRLILSIVVEQMRFDYLERFGPLMSDNGFKWLFNQGTSFQHATYAYNYTQTAPAYGTLFTGTYPSSHGIVSDEWYDADLKLMLGATQDLKAFPVGGSYASGQHSPRQLQASTLGDAIKLGTSSKGKVFGLSLDPHGAILPAGFMADGAFWFDPVNGTWMTSNFYMSKLPSWLERLNNLKHADHELSNKWIPLFSADLYTRCLPDENPYEIGFLGQTTFPYDPKNIQSSKLYADPYQVLKYLPSGNTLTKELAESVIEEEHLGTDEFTDFLSVSFAATEYIGQLFGPYAIETADAFLRLDHDLADFLSFLDQKIGLNQILIVFTSTGGCVDPPQYMADQRMSVDYFNANSAISLLTSYLHAVYGNKEWIQAYRKQQIYLNQSLIEESKISNDEILASIASFMSDFSGIASVISSQDLLRNDYAFGINQKIQYGFFKKRSGDILFSLLPGWMEKSTLVTDHNSPYAYDAQVPLVFCGWNIPVRKVEEHVDLISVAPTLTNILQMSPPNGSIGTPLYLK